MLERAHLKSKKEVEALMQKWKVPLNCVGIDGRHKTNEVIQWASENRYIGPVQAGSKTVASSVASSCVTSAAQVLQSAERLSKVGAAALPASLRFPSFSDSTGRAGRVPNEPSGASHRPRTLHGEPGVFKNMVPRPISCSTIGQQSLQSLNVSPGGTFK